MNVNIIAIGKLKEEYLKAAFAEYEKRLSAFCRFSLIEISECRLSDSPSLKETENALDSEGAVILQKLGKSNACNIALCVEGREMSSEEFAAVLENAPLSGKSTVNIIIGSSCGLSEKVKHFADLRFSMSRMTFPHQLARVIIAEQIYRGFMINSGKKYHK